MTHRSIAKARGRKSTAPIIRKPSKGDACEIGNTVDVTDRNGHTRTIQARSIREAMRMEGDRG